MWENMAQKPNMCIHSKYKNKIKVQTVECRLYLTFSELKPETHIIFVFGLMDYSHNTKNLNTAKVDSFVICILSVVDSTETFFADNK